MSYKIELPPDNAKVIADDLRMTYASTPCVVFNTLDRELIANRAEISDSSKPLQLYSYASEKTFAEVRADARWTRDKACDYVTGFDQIVTRWMRLGRPPVPLDRRRAMALVAVPCSSRSDWNTFALHIAGLPVH